ncbi:MAG: NAD(P)/FAD-dependent oxidoreductase [Actinobacteria bacterium]|nr:NAD(P)/FAD-dependent oxidoreductase [Actinomycetota bacterium]
MAGDSRSFDAIFVGSGINSMVAGAMLAKRGWRVAVLERAERLGGNVYTEVTEGGFATELLSLNWLPFVGSGGYQDLRVDLERHGLRFANTDKPWAVLTDDGKSLIMTTDHARNVERIERLRAGEGRAWDAAISAIYKDAGDLFGIRDVYPWSAAGLGWAMGLRRRRGAAGTRVLLSELLISARVWLNQTFQDPLVKGLIAPWALHGISGPEQPSSGLMIRAATAFTEAGGTPLPIGGGREVIAALAAIIGENGGTCVTGADVDRVLVENGKATGVLVGDTTYRAKRAVACCVTPKQLYERLLDKDVVPAEMTESVAKWRAGCPLFQLHYSLKKPLEWRSDEDLSGVSVINVNNGLDEISTSAGEAVRGLLPRWPNLCVAQPMAVDPSRGPAGGWQIYIQVGEIPADLVGDAAGKIDVSGGWTERVREEFSDRLESRLVALLPGLRENMIERIALSPADLEAINMNLIGGGAGYGTGEIDQMLPGLPSPFAPSPNTNVKRLFQIGGSTHPGPGLGGGSGYLLAQKLAGGGRVRAIRRILPGGGSGAATSPYGAPPSAGE